MVVRALELIGLWPGHGPDDARLSAVAAVLRVEREQGGGWLLSAGPLAVLRFLPDAAVAASVRCKPFTLAVRHDRACFDRYLRLPVTLRGLGLGTWLMSSLVRQAVDRGLGAARVRSLHLVARDASELRDSFYRSMGFAVTVWRDGSGWARAARLDGLRRRANPAKVRLLHYASVSQVPSPDALMHTLAAGTRTG